MTNSTIRKFGFPDSLIHEYEHWVVLLRQNQVTLGSLVLAEKSEATSLSGVSPTALAELAPVARDIETAFAQTLVPDKFNYLMLMMVDPHVHFHVFPRYASNVEFAGETFVDDAWPKAPSPAYVLPMTEPTHDALLGALRDAWQP